MWMRFEDAQVAIENLKKQIPSPKGSKQEWDLYHQHFHWFLWDLVATAGELPDVLGGKYNRIFTKEFYPDGGIPVEADWIMRGYAKEQGIKQWLPVLSSWLEGGFKRGLYPVKRQPKQTEPQKGAVKGWWFFGNGKNSILQVNGVNIHFESTAEGKGRGYPIILLQILSWPGTLIVSEAEFGRAVRHRWGFEEADTDHYKPRAFTDAIRDLNKKVKESLKCEEDFLTPNGSGYSVNQKFL